MFWTPAVFIPLYIITYRLLTNFIALYISRRFHIFNKLSFSFVMKAPIPHRVLFPRFSGWTTLPLPPTLQSRCIVYHVQTTAQLASANPWLVWIEYVADFLHKQRQPYFLPVYILPEVPRWDYPCWPSPEISVLLHSKDDVLQNDAHVFDKYNVV